ncbi:MAG: DUF192 domain-containing protein [Candidatus Thiodiazotropha sp.]
MNGELIQDSSDLVASMADTFLSRLRGLLGKKRLGENEGLLLKRCAAVHTVGMHYSLDIIFMDKKGMVLKCIQGVKPFRTVSVRGAYYTLEMNQGTISKQGISVKDSFTLETVKKESMCTREP